MGAGFGVFNAGTNCSESGGEGGPSGLKVVTLSRLTGSPTVWQVATRTSPVPRQEFGT